MRTHYKNINLIFSDYINICRRCHRRRHRRRRRCRNYRSPIGTDKMTFQATTQHMRLPSIAVDSDETRVIGRRPIRMAHLRITNSTMHASDCDRFQSANSNAIRNRLNKGLIDLRFDLDGVYFIFCSLSADETIIKNN